jgi:hypothetical protein
MSSYSTNIGQNLATIEEKIAKACVRPALSGDKIIRDPKDVNLVAVSKKQPVERVKALLECGHRLFGENRVQDAIKTWEPLKKNYPDVKIHLIGPLQSNKVCDAVAFFDVIETVDRPKLVHALSAEMKKQDRSLPCFVQVNTGEEEQKAGVLPQDLNDLLSLAKAGGLDVTGLMCIPPIDEPPGLHFALLKKLADQNNLKELSMGMSSDFEKAIPLGATYVRVGSALFGERES